MRWMNLEPIIQSEVSQKGKDKYCILTHVYVMMNLFAEQQQIHRDTDIENRLMDTAEGQGGKCVECMERATWKHTLPYVK